MRATRLAPRAPPPRATMKRRQSTAIGVSPGQRRLTDTLSRFAECPVCARSIPKHEAARHVETCLASRADSSEPREVATTGSEPAGPSMASPARSPPSDASAPNALAMLRPSDALVARVRVGAKDAPWTTRTLRECRERFGVPLHVVERALPPADADALLAELLVEGQTWTQDRWWIAGEPRLAPRLTALYEMFPGGGEAPDDDDHPDAPAAAHHLRAPTALMRAAADAAGRAATAALALPVGPDASAASESAPLSSDAGSRPWVPTYTVANLYRDGKDRVGPHADRLTSLGPLPIIVGYSLGSTRTFRLRRRWRDDGEDVIVDVPLPHNSACVMLPPCQELWQHEVLRDGASRGNQPRVSLTFRKRDEQWEKRAPACECGRRCVLKTRRGDQPPPAFAAGASDEAEAGARKTRGRRAGVRGEGDRGDVPVVYYYTCDSVNGGEPCRFYQPLETRALGWGSR